jgi:hypothetical protein
MNDNIDLSLFQGEKEETYLLRPIYKTILTLINLRPLSPLS